MLTTTLKRILGMGLIALGIVGTLLPIMPGFVFILLGLGMLGIDHPLVRQAENFVKKYKRKLAQQQEV
ncbi:MAG: hypothetical protein H6695_05965 [Deferribacteres bacterium]|nr:hypothetical protein [Deferribacteres bacterium]